MKFVSIRKTRFARLGLAMVLLLGIFFLLRTQQSPHKSPDRIKKDLSLHDIIKLRSPILHPRNVKNDSLPYSVEYRNGRWTRTWLSTPSPHLWTAIYSELSNRIPGKPRFSSERYLETALSRWETDQRPYVKENSLFLIGYLYEITKNPDYLNILIKESDAVIQGLSEKDYFTEHKAILSEWPYLILRALSVRIAYEESPNEDFKERLIEFFRGTLLDQVKQRRNPINHQCSYLWSLAPLLETDPALREEFESDSITIYHRFLASINSNPEDLFSLSNVLACVHAFAVTGKFYDIPEKRTLDIALDHYIKAALNYPQQNGCPRSGGFFAKPAAKDNCKDRKMYLSENVWMTYILYKGIFED